MNKMMTQVRTRRWLHAFPLWLGITTLSAAPAFCMALIGSDLIGLDMVSLEPILAMLGAALLFATLFTYLACSGLYFRIMANPPLYRVFRRMIRLRLGYCILILLFGPLMFIPAVTGELWIGLYAIKVSEGLVGLLPYSWRIAGLEVFVIAFVHAATVTFILLCFVGANYGLSRARKRRGSNHRPIDGERNLPEVPLPCKN